MKLETRIDQWMSKVKIISALTAVGFSVVLAYKNPFAIESYLNYVTSIACGGSIGMLAFIIGSIEGLRRMKSWSKKDPSELMRQKTLAEWTNKLDQLKPQKN